MKSWADARGLDILILRDLPLLSYRSPRYFRDLVDAMVKDFTRFKSVQYPC